MSRILKLGVLTFFTSFIFGFIICGDSSANMVSTPEDYIQYLTEKGKTESDALKVKAQFQKLPSQKQKKFVEYLNDPAILKAIFSDVDPNTNKVLYGGDVVISHTVTQEETAIPAKEEQREGGLKNIIGMITPLFLSTADAAPAKKQFSLQDKRTVKSYGIIVGCYSVWLKYEASGPTVTKIIGGNGSYTNSYPCTTITKESCDKYIYGNKAHTAVVWAVTIGIPGLNFTGNVHHHVLGNASGGKSYRFWKEL